MNEATKQKKKLSAVASHLNKTSSDLISNNKNKNSPFASTTQEILYRKMFTSVNADNKHGNGTKNGNGKHRNGSSSTSSLPSRHESKGESSGREGARCVQ